MKILFACYFELPHYGGLGRYVDTLRSELEAHGHQVDVLSHHPGMQQIYKFSYVPDTFGWTLRGRQIDKSTNSHDGRVTIKDVIDHQVWKYFEDNLPHVDPSIRWREIERYTFEIAAALHDVRGYDLIHTHDILSTRALWRVKPKNVPLVATIHGILATEYVNAGEITTRDSLRWQYAVAEEYYGHLSSDATIVPTNWQKTQLSKYYQVPSEKINVIPYGMNLYPFLQQLEYDPYPPLTETKPSDDKTIIVCPARLVPEKDHQTLIEALAQIHDTRDDFECWLIGDGHLRYELELQAKRLGVRDRIVFFGARWDVPAFLRLSDIVVLPSIQDMHPYTLMEAQVAGKPCVASNAGGIPEVVRDRQTGLIFEMGNSRQLANHLMELMDDPRLAYTLGQNAKKWATVQYASATLFERTMKIYEQVLAGKLSSQTFPIPEPNLTGEYGLVKSRQPDNDHSNANLFKFSLDHTKLDDIKDWRPVRKRTSVEYAIPDPAFIQVLASHKQA
ncbi:glycosyltransferase family 4 protein [Alicyclobacillus cycloheptanicus]|uniref:Glycosyltransferase involved in cell wall biosynthesis n=1 Tax=Alicyclobacillus cycloheptanicus TaxID=1457 RepID=A0ABT9XKK0_9BACL|nr:glycosyltransferase family 4 protein [Alicyclobacillus cycloheptanicus]MDQ0190827.1 glycosyltransferase involved in cell wall biosynthesis [Alicyclobacillus cycloheptanicus]WDM01473.1 glycosyltransferase family 4 protein [Alicyclobacillus cycloheptanicus]